MNEATHRAQRRRSGLLRVPDRAESTPGAGQEATETPPAVRRSSDARRDAAPIPAPGASQRPKLRQALRLATIWFVAIAAVCVLGSRSRLADDSGELDRIAVGALATESAIVAALPPTEAPTSTATLPFPASVPVQIEEPTPTVTGTPVPSATPVPTATTMPTATPLPPTAIPSPPTAVPLPPTPTPEPPTPTPELPPSEPEPEPEPETPTPPPAPTPTPPFRATDRIGAPTPVNLRAGPGTGYASLGALPTGTLLSATGETTYAGGFTWRRFRLADGRVGWVRQADVLPVR